jgi:hypothetical protein
MDGLLQQPAASDRDSNWKPILAGLAVVLIVVGAIALLLRDKPKPQAPPHPYASKLQLSDLKMSAAENFVGASVTYLDGIIINTGNQTVTHVMTHVIFKNALGENAQVEDISIRVLDTSGPYADTADLSRMPLLPGQSRPFRLTFEHVSTDWNHEFPSLQVTDVTVK